MLTTLLALTFVSSSGFVLPPAHRRAQAARFSPRGADAGVARHSSSGDSGVAPSTELAVLLANTAFYDAFRAGNMSAMRACWSDDERACSVVHPGQPPVFGRAEVLSSWELVLAAPPPISPTSARVVFAAGDVAWLHCFESVRVNAVAQMLAPLDDAGQEQAAAAELEMRLAATNVFKRDEGGAWKVVMHQAGPCS